MVKIRVAAPSSVDWRYGVITKSGCSAFDSTIKIRIGIFVCESTNRIADCWNGECKEANHFIKRIRREWVVAIEKNERKNEMKNTMESAVKSKVLGAAMVSFFSASYNFCN